MKKIMYMMRHGETLFNKRRKIQGWCDSPLTELGVRQALGARKYFEEAGIEFTHLYSSSLQRCCDTLEYVTGKEDYIRDKDLREMNFGTYEGESEDLNPPSHIKETYFANFGGETRNQVKERLSKACTKIMERDDHNCVLVVSHSGACYHFMRNYVTEEESNKQLKLGFKNCSIFKYEYENGTFKLLDVIRPEPVKEEK